MSKLIMWRPKYLHTVETRIKGDRETQAHPTIREESYQFISQMYEDVKNHREETRQGC